MSQVVALTTSPPAPPPFPPLSCWQVGQLRRYLQHWKKAAAVHYAIHTEACNTVERQKTYRK